MERGLVSGFGERKEPLSAVKELDLSTLKFLSAKAMDGGQYAEGLRTCWDDYRRGHGLVFGMKHDGCREPGGSRDERRVWETIRR